MLPFIMHDITSKKACKMYVKWHMETEKKINLKRMFLWLIVSSRLSYYSLFLADLRFSSVSSLGAWLRTLSSRDESLCLCSSFSFSWASIKKTTNRLDYSNLIKPYKWLFMLGVVYTSVTVKPCERAGNNTHSKFFTMHW